MRSWTGMLSVKALHSVLCTLFRYFPTKQTMLHTILHVSSRWGTSEAEYEQQCFDLWPLGLGL